MKSLFGQRPGGRQTSGLPTDFDPKRDLELHQDLREAKADPETHYLLHGRKEGGTTADGPRASDRLEIIL